MSKIKFYIVFFSAVLCYGFASAQTVVRAGLFVTSKLSAFALQSTAADAILTDSVQPPLPLKKNKLFYFTVRNDSVLVRTADSVYGAFARLTVYCNDSTLFKIKAVTPDLASRQYEGTLTIVAKENRLFLTNTLEINRYVAGVVEAEAGGGHEKEYYKVQAIICRTYALSNLHRHEAEGFQLCDQVHCQVYRGRNKLNRNIAIATFATNNLVLVDEHVNLVTTAFHSNCGGQTCNSEDVWNLPKPYLRSVTDTFCLQRNNATWKKELKREDWLQYLTKEYKFIAHDSDTVALMEALHFSQPARKTTIGTADKGVVLKNVRTDFNLKSTFFSVQSDSSKVVLLGRGYGHGVGLCQEGAMEMAKRGMSFFDILHFYYQGVYIIDLRRYQFFKDEL